MRIHRCNLTSAESYRHVVRIIPRVAVQHRWCVHAKLEIDLCGVKRWSSFVQHARYKSTFQCFLFVGFCDCCLRCTTCAKNAQVHHLSQRTFSTSPMVEHGPFRIAHDRAAFKRFLTRSWALFASACLRAGHVNHTLCLSLELHTQRLERENMRILVA